MTIKEFVSKSFNKLRIIGKNRETDLLRKYQEHEHWEALDISFISIPNLDRQKEKCNATEWYKKERSRSAIFSVEGV